MACTARCRTTVARVVTRRFDAIQFHPFRPGRSKRLDRLDEAFHFSQSIDIQTSDVLGSYELAAEVAFCSNRAGTVTRTIWRASARAEVRGTPRSRATLQTLPMRAAMRSGGLPLSSVGT